MDLPFAPRRWRRQASLKRTQLLSDCRDASLATAYGLLILEFRLLARALFLVDSHRIVRYKEIVDETEHEPDYDAVREAIRRVE